MNLYIMRHAEAVHPSGWPSSDSSRPLSSNGEKQAAALAAEWVRSNFSLGRILTSPFIRAQKTADILAKPLHLTAVPIPTLASGTKPDFYRNALMNSGVLVPTLIVGHMPELGFFASKVTGVAALLEASFDTLEIMAFEVEDDLPWGTGRMLWRRTLEDWEKLKP